MAEPITSGSMEGSGSIAVVAPSKVNKPAPKRTDEVVAQSVPTHYKLNFRTSRGTVRRGFGSQMPSEMGKRWGDLLHAIPSSRWCTLDQIVQLVWDAEKRNPFQMMKRSRRQIEDGVADLVAARILLTK